MPSDFQVAPPSSTAPLYLETGYSYLNGIPQDPGFDQAHLALWYRATTLVLATVAEYRFYDSASAALSLSDYQQLISKSGVANPIDTIGLPAGVGGYSLKGATQGREVVVLTARLAETIWAVVLLGKPLDADVISMFAFKLAGATR